MDVGAFYIKKAPGYSPEAKNLKIAESQGFEPWIPFWGIHTFQACSFDHSDSSPFCGLQK